MPIIPDVDLYWLDLPDGIPLLILFPFPTRRSFGFGLCLLNPSRLQETRSQPSNPFPSFPKQIFKVKMPVGLWLKWSMLSHCHLDNLAYLPCTGKYGTFPKIQDFYIKARIFQKARRTRGQLGYRYIYICVMICIYLHSISIDEF